MTFLREAPTGVFLFALLMVGLLGAVMIVAALWARRNANAIRSLPPTEVSDLSPGRHLVWGRVAAPKLRSPLTGRACAWWQVEVWESRREERARGRISLVWTRVRYDQSPTPLVLTDGKTECLVVPHGAMLVPSAWSDWRGEHEKPRGEEPELRTEGIPGYGIRNDPHGETASRFRYVEQYIWHDAPLFVLGRIAPATRSKRNAPTGWQVQGPPRDHGHSALADFISPDARAAFARLSGPPFIVSTRHPREVLGEQELAAKAGLPFGLGFAVLAGFMAWVRYGG